METEEAGWGHAAGCSAQINVTVTLVGGTEAAAEGRLRDPFLTEDLDLGSERSSFDEDYATGQEPKAAGPAAAGLKPTLCEGHRGHIVVDAGAVTSAPASTASLFFPVGSQWCRAGPGTTSFTTTLQPQPFH